MKFKIHRGTQEIGGSCVEIWTESTRIVLDFGMPLVNPDHTKFDSRAIKDQSVDKLRETGILPDIASLYTPGEKTALIISHAHQDHYGFINYLHDDCSVYMGEATHRLIEITNLILSKEWSIQNPQYFQSGKSFKVGDIKITPFLMDHSAFDAYAFLIEADGISLFYSGDFRTHGRKSGAFKWFASQINRPVDYLLLEGTTIGRSDLQLQTETDIENEFIRTFTESSGINMIYTSGQNIDRIVSIYRACKQSNKTLVVDFYIANILKELAKFAKLPFPSKNFSDISVFFPYRLSQMVVRQGNEKLLYRFKAYKITREQIDQKYQDIVMLVRPSMQGDLAQLTCLDQGVFTYSLWEGYKKEKSTRDFIDFMETKGVSQQYLHTSGHADQEALRQMVDILKPKYLVPMHTFEGDEYSSVFENSNILRVLDGEVVDCLTAT